MASKLVLLAEPDEDHRNIFRTILEHHGYRVVEAADGAGAASVALEQRPDLVIVAFPLEIPGGGTVIESLRGASETAATPILAVTAEAAPWAAERARDLGANEHCSKPVNPRRVAIQVRRMIGPSLDD